MNEEQVTEALLDAPVLNVTYENKSKIICSVCGLLSTQEDVI